MSDGYPSEQWVKQRLQSVNQIIDGLLEQSTDLNSLICRHQEEKKLLEQLLTNKMVKRK